MWQHAANIIIGLLLTAVSIFGCLIGAVRSEFAWIFIGAGLGIIVLSVWGLTDEFSHETGEGSGA